ncbi:ABC transporter ATP-binding protein [Candidatus Saccharibacteria bacterium]|nr:ABC transporter ATP-binding protein [Candidatus Saccharibacteria bacterium]
MAAVIRLDSVTKMYGPTRGIANVTLEIEQGAVFGFLGPNGAGKSTTINLLVDLIRPSSGAIKLFGLDSVKDSLKIRQRIGFLTGDMALDGHLTALEQLTYFGNLRGGVSSRRIHELASRLGLDLHRRIKQLSRGNRQKVGLVSALMHDPELLIFDEPTTGLDPLIQAQFNEIIMNHKKRGKTTFVSSHMLSEVQEICDRVAFIREGQIIDIKPMRDIVTGAPKRIKVVGADKGLKIALQKLAGVQVGSTEHTELDFTFAGDINALLELLSKHTVRDVVIQEADLETIFMQYYQRDRHA